MRVLVTAVMCEAIIRGYGSRHPIDEIPLMMSGQGAAHNRCVFPARVILRLLQTYDAACHLEGAER